MPDPDTTTPQRSVSVELGGNAATTSPELTEEQIIEMTRAGNIAKLWHNQQEYADKFRAQHRPRRRLMEMRINFRP
jgi:hypothetical protein